MRSIIVIAHNLRSAHNVGSLLRTAEGLGIKRVYLTGYTPFPQQIDDIRLPHIAAKVNHNIAKTALGAEHSQSWEHRADIDKLLIDLRSRGYVIAALEQWPTAQQLHNYRPPERLAVVLGREVEGLEPDVIESCDLQLMIPMSGHKESFNVVQAAAMAMYHCRFQP
ncbi:MAG: TrmH family RNA methyltransferase [Candidatus Saccharimonadales bacterium]